MEHKTHFKLHKVKKHWITIAISSLTLGIIASTGNIAYAEQPELPLTNQTIENSIVFEESAINTSNTFIDEKTTSQSESSLETSTNHSTTTDTYTVDNNSKVSLPEDSTVPSSSEASLEGATNVSEASSIETQEDNSITGGNFITDEYGNWYYIKDNQKLTGFQTVDGVPLYFDQDGIQAKGNFVTVDNETYYFDKDSGRKLTNQFVTDGGYGWYYLGADGKAVKGAQTIDNFDLYFDDRGYQIKGSLVNIGEQTYYFDPYNGRKVKDKKIYVHGGTFYFDESGAAVKNRFISDNEGFWYYFDKDGHMVTFSQIIDGYSLYFHKDGKQAKGQLISIWGTHTGTHYFDKDNGREVKNAIFELDGKSYEADNNGIVKELPTYRNQYISENGNDWSYYDGFGHKLIGFHNIDGVNVYFDDNGIQAKGKITTIGTDTYFFEKDNGAMRTNQLSVIPTRVEKTVNVYGTDIDIGENVNITYYFGPDGKAIKGFHTIDGQTYYFNDKGWALDGIIHEKDGDYFLQNYHLIYNQFVNTYSDNQDDKTITGTYYVNGEGKVQVGWLNKDNNRYYLDPEAGGKVTYGWKEIDNKFYHFTEKDNQDSAGQLIRNQTYQDGDTLVTNDQEGIVTRSTEKRQTFVKDALGNSYYVTNDGTFLTGPQVVDGISLYFDKDGKQVKGQLRKIDGHIHYYDKLTGEMMRNRFVTLLLGEYVPEEDYEKVIHFGTPAAPGSGSGDGGASRVARYYFDKDGKAITGRQTINGKDYNFQQDGRAILNKMVDFGGQSYFYGDDGAMVKNQTVLFKFLAIMRQFTVSYHFDENGVGHYVHHNNV